MPLLSISGQAAMENLRSNRMSLWPDGRRDRSRLSGVAEVAVQPSFSLSPGEPIFTMGSCFARNIERRLEDLGYEIPTRALTLPASERASDIANDLLNKFAPHSILNEVRWAIDPDASFPAAGYLQVGENKWHDPHLAMNTRAAPLQRVEERREAVSAIHRRIPECRTLVMTLGLVEAWWDDTTQLYLNGAPPAGSLPAEPERFRLDILSVEEIVQVLEDLSKVLDLFGHPEWRMLLTVSPVPMKSTFSGQDAITANTYSKSALRAAAEVFVRRHDNVDYFPSYEIVTHTLRTSAFIQDNRHVNDDVVRAIVSRVEAGYSNGNQVEDAFIKNAKRIGAQAREALRAGDYAEAARRLGSLEDTNRHIRAGFDTFTYRLEYGRALARCDRRADAAAQLQLALAIDPQSAFAWFTFGLIQAKLGRPIEAEEAIAKAVDLEPKVLDRRLRYALQLLSNGKADSAREQLETVLRLDPEQTAAAAALAVLKPAASELDRSSSSLAKLLQRLRGDDPSAVKTDGETIARAGAFLREAFVTPKPATTA